MRLIKSMRLTTSFYGMLQTGKEHVHIWEVEYLFASRYWSITTRIDMAWVMFNTALKEVCQEKILTWSSIICYPSMSVIWWRDMQVPVLFSKWPLPATPTLAVDFKLKNHIIISCITTVRDLLATSRACTVVFSQA